MSVECIQHLVSRVTGNVKEHFICTVRALLRHREAVIAECVVSDGIR